MSPRSRYDGLASVEWGGRVGLAQRPASTPAASGSITHVVVAGETLDSLARRYYGDERAWWAIADANPARVAIDLRPGDELVIPPLGRRGGRPSR